MRNYLKLLGLLLVLSIFIMGQAGCPGCGGVGVGFGKISGVVSGSIPNTCIYRATVTATSGDKTYSTLTDESGRYELGVPSGTYTVSVSKETFNNDSRSVTVNAGETKTLDFTLTTGSGGTITDLPDNPLFLPIAQTVPSGIDIRSLKFDPSKNKSLEFNLKSLPIAPRDSGDYKSYVMLQVNLLGISDYTGIKGIRFYRSNSPNGPFTLVDFSLILNYSYYSSLYYTSFVIDTNVTPGTTMYYTFSLWGDSGESELQEPVEIKILEPCILSSPTNEYNVDSFPIIFSWNPVEGAEGYQIYVMDLNGNYIWRNYTTDTSIEYYGTDDYNNPIEPGYYLWYVQASEVVPNMSFISISYPRKFTY